MTTNHSKRVFYLSTPEQLLMKFAWELKNLKNVLAEQSQIFRSHEIAAYHIYNTAVTAWHVSDWTWNYLSKETQTKLAANLGFCIAKKNTDNLKNFQRAIREKSRALEICWDVANGSKHFESHQHSKINAKVEVESKIPTALEFKASHPLRSFSYDFKVEWNSQTLRMVDVFEEARNFWLDFLADLDLADPIYIEIDFEGTITRRSEK